MKLKLHDVFIVIAILIFSSCDDSFLENQGMNTDFLPDTLYVMNDITVQDLELNYEPAGNSNYTILQFPGWLDFESLDGKFNNGKTYLNFTTNNEPYFGQLGVYEGRIEMKINEFGILSLPVVYFNFGNPAMSLSTTNIEIGEEFTYSFLIQNTSNDILYWELDTLPEWLKVSEQNGLLGAKETATLVFMVERKDLENGEYTDVITIHCNAAEKISTVEVSMAVTEATSRLGTEIIEGEVTDAVYMKAKDLLAVCTKMPNRVLIYNFENNSMQQIKLDKSPSCIDFSDDGNYAVIGYTMSWVSRINLQNQEVEKTIEIDCIPYDIVYGEDEWCYITPETESWGGIRSLNLNTEALKQSNEHIYNKSIIKKPANRKMLIGTSLQVSPNGLEFYKIGNNNLISDTTAHYHKSTENFWLSEDGNNIFCGTGIVYKTPTLPIENSWSVPDPPIMGRMEKGQHNITWIDHNESANTVYVAYKDYGKPSVIEQFNASNLNSTKVIQVQNYYHNSINYEVTPQYVFTNKEGILLLILKNATTQYNPTNIWALDIMPVH